MASSHAVVSAKVKPKKSTRSRGGILARLGVLAVLTLSGVSLLLMSGSPPAKTLTASAYSPRLKPQQSPPGMIDGSKTPDLIPDPTAYRLWLVAVSQPHGASEEKKKHQRAQLNMLGPLKDVDRQTLEFALADFKSQYLELIEEYNEEARQALASNGLPDLTGFLLRRSALVQSTRDRLMVSLSKEGSSRVEAHVKAEKRHMKVAMREGQ